MIQVSLSTNQGTVSIYSVDVRNIFGINGEQAVVF